MPSHLLIAMISEASAFERNAQHARILLGDRVVRIQHHDDDVRLIDGLQSLADTRLLYDFPRLSSGAARLATVSMRTKSRSSRRKGTRMLVACGAWLRARDDPSSCPRRRLTSVYLPTFVQAD